jgi:hypothetical protein
LHRHVVSQGADVLVVELRTNGGEFPSGRDAVVVDGQDGDQHVPRGGALDGDVLDGRHLERMIDVSPDRSGGAQAFKGELHTEAEIRVGLHDGGDGRDGGKVGGDQRLAGHAEEGGELVEVRAASVGQHHGLGSIVHASTGEDLAVSGDLQNLEGGVGLDQGGECRVTGLKVRKHLGEDDLVVQRLDDGGGRERAEVDGSVVSH